jgi:hypothetical protein
MNPSALKQAQWLAELEELIRAVDDGRIATSRRADWLSVIRNDVDHLRDRIFLRDHFTENQAHFRRVESSLQRVKISLVE